MQETDSGPVTGGLAGIATASPSNTATAASGGGSDTSTSGSSLSEEFLCITDHFP
jgi:hypothetical protein